MIPKPTLHSLAQKFRARARNARSLAKSYIERDDKFMSHIAVARSETLDECAQEIEKLKQTQ